MQFPRVTLPSSLRAAVRKRQIEFVAGRHCAREALSRCAPELAAAPIGLGEHREPLWPQGVVGSITHTAGYASAAVARTHHAAAIGLDVERWIEADVANNIIDHIACHEEVEMLARSTGLPFTRALTVIFSAKEALFKCLFPIVQRYFDFREASILCVNPEQHALEARLLVSLTPAIAAGHVVRGRYEPDDLRVCTSMLIPQA